MVKRLSAFQASIALSHDSSTSRNPGRESDSRGAGEKARTSWDSIQY